MAMDSCLLARRLSGGGAVYHDLGNLNFTFISQKPHYDISGNNQVIIDALNQLGINAYVSGRNDLLVDDKKFSGHAYYQHKQYAYHHGTLMVEVDLENLGKYLNVSASKLKSHGVQSVKSRVTNLKEYQPDLSLDQLKQALICSLETKYQLQSQSIELDQTLIEAVETLSLEYQSQDWLYHPKLVANLSHQKRYLWGELGISAQLKQNHFDDVIIHSDAMETEFVKDLEKLLTGLPFNQNLLREIISNSNLENKTDILNFIDDLF